MSYKIHKSGIRKIKNLTSQTAAIFLIFLICVTGCDRFKEKHPVQIIFTSDSHFGYSRSAFRGDSNVSAFVVNEAMVNKMNTLPNLTLPTDSGACAGLSICEIDYLINTGDIANRSEPGIQSAAKSWEQFTTAYINGLTTKNRRNQKTELCLLPGNHDVSNAIGHYKIVDAPADNTALLGIYNYMFPEDQKISASYKYATDKIHYSKDVAGVHFVFVNIWPDSEERAWMENDLKWVDESTPVVLFAHDEPNVESKHFRNPNGVHSINTTDQFENLLSDVFKDGTTILDTSFIEQREFVSFLKAHPNIKAYFHGNAHANRFYDYKGPDQDVSLKTIEVDSPMKGVVSSLDETKMSFQLITLDPETKLMTVRQCLWNTNPTKPETPIAWGVKTTIQL
jgi:hypothetical protein